MSNTEQEGFSAAEKAAMKERAAEVRAPKKRMTKAEKAEQARREVEEKIASFEGNDKVLAEKLHRHHIGAVVFKGGVRTDEVVAMMRLVGVEPASDTRPIGLGR